MYSGKLVVRFKRDLVSHQLITSDGQVIMSNSQENGKKTPVVCKSDC